MGGRGEKVEKEREGERFIDGDLILATKVRNLPSLKAEETEKGSQEGEEESRQGKEEAVKKLAK